MLSSLNFSQVTPIQKEDLKKIKIILQSLLDHNDACDFRQPVDWKGLGLNDYPQVVKNPMDLGTVNKKFNSGNYASVEQLLDDIQLIWDNCKKYNPPKSWIYQIGERLQRAFRKMARNYFPDMGITVPIKIQDQTKKQSSLIGLQEDYQDITYHDKLKFSQQLSYLSAKKLQKIIKQIKQECPTAYRESQDGKCQILVDNIQLNKFAQLFTHIRQVNNQIEEKNQKVEENINQSKDPKPSKKVKTS